MLKSLLERFQTLASREDVSSDDAMAALRPVAMQICGMLMDEGVDGSRVSDEDWGVITNQEMRKSMICMFVGVSTNRAVMEVLDKMSLV